MKRNSAELIVREAFDEDGSRGGRTYIVPRLLIAGNREGFRWLAKYFADYAEREWDEDREHDPDDSSYIPTDCRPFSDLSSLVFIRVARFTAKNRGRVLKKWNLSRRTRARGDLRDRYARLIERANAWLGYLEKCRREVREERKAASRQLRRAPRKPGKKTNERGERRIKSEAEGC